MSRFNERVLKRKLAPGPVEPPEGLLAKLREEIPEELPRPVRAGAESRQGGAIVAFPRRSWSPPAQLWKIAAALVLLAGAGWLALRLGRDVLPERAASLETAAPETGGVIEGEAKVEGSRKGVASPILKEEIVREDAREHREGLRRQLLDRMELAQRTAAQPEVAAAEAEEQARVPAARAAEPVPAPRMAEPAPASPPVRPAAAPPPAPARPSASPPPASAPAQPPAEVAAEHAALEAPAAPVTLGADVPQASERDEEAEPGRLQRVYAEEVVVHDEVSEVTAAPSLAAKARRIDTGAYLRVRRPLREGRLPPPEAVQPEQIVAELSPSWGEGPAARRLAEAVTAWAELLRASPRAQPEDWEAVLAQAREAVAEGFAGQSEVQELLGLMEASAEIARSDEGAVPRR